MRVLINGVFTSSGLKAVAIIGVLMMWPLPLAGARNLWNFNYSLTAVAHPGGGFRGLKLPVLELKKQHILLI